MVSPCDVDRPEPERALLLPVFNKDGDSIPFRDILDRQDSAVERTLVVFIRHFFCGNCQEYVRRLTTELSPSTIPDDLSIIIVGCGAPSLIPSYLEVTSCPFQLYADPSTQLYKALGMRKSLSLGPRNPAYIQHSLASGMVKSVVQGLKRIPSGDVAKAGDMSVNGGEFILVRSSTSAWRASWSHCMMNSRDHTEIDALKARLSLEHVGQHAHDLPLGDARPDNTECDAPRSSTDTANTLCTQRSGSGKRSISLRRQSWMTRAGWHIRSSSIRNNLIDVS